MRGFTIVELLVVIVVIGILAGISTVAYNGLQARGYDSSVLADIDALDGLQTNYGVKNGTGGKAYYSGTTASDSQLGFTVSPGNIIDVVVDSNDYCIRGYNPKGNHASLSNAYTKESSVGACSRLGASAVAVADSPSTPLSIAWTQRTSAGLRLWSGVASSSDGAKLTAIVNGGYIYTSSDSGVSWTERTSAGSRAWYSVASSSDGTKLAATVDGGYIYTSTDSGATWTARTTAGSRQWWGQIASSANGSVLVAAPSWGNPYTSTDSGATWTQRSVTGSNNWRGFAISADGTKISGVASSNPVWRSADSGVTWTSQTIGSVQWYDVAMTADGSKIIISPTGNLGPINRSTDSGTNFSALSNLGGGNCWQGLSSSSDGTKLAGASGSCGQGYIYLSTDSGSAWTQDTSLGRANWTSIASSSSGLKLVTAADSRFSGGSFVANGYIFTGTYN